MEISLSYFAPELDVGALYAASVGSVQGTGEGIAPSLYKRGGG